ncbi:glycosyltransferase family 4 protein [Cupriavidus gilardii]|uniref:glycosyltransferase family 4 protein n=1 Tax=Cupriavidus gilardii TaxID=82541 RepID=UPI0007E3D521|nr:glycosyltransferase family 4 protein [Cupriavidus gilardii]
MTSSGRVLGVARYLYHRVPLPQAVKWRLRERAGPLLLALHKADLDGDLLGNLKQAFNPFTSKDAFDREAAQRAALRLYADTAAHCRLHGPLTHIIALPFLGNGGAERTALQFARAVVASGSRRSVAVWVTDRDMVSNELALPAGVQLVNLWRYLPAQANEDARVAFLRDCLMTLRPDVFHVINSDIGWKLVCREGKRLAATMRLFGSIFAFQFTRDFASRIGYAEYYLRDAIDSLDGLFSDNLRFQNDAIETYGLSRARQKFFAVYNACRIAEGDWREDARCRLAQLQEASPGEPLDVLWAGRLDEEKRVDLLYEVAAQCPDFRFHVYGESVVGARLQMPELDNLRYHGPFADPAHLVKQRAYDAFLFTSRWEGMPNMLLEVGALGVPIVAPEVGGIGELIGESTGFLVPARPTASDYVKALTAISADRRGAASKAECLLELIEARHTWPAFSERLASVPNYLEASS